MHGYHVAAMMPRPEENRKYNEASTGRKCPRRNLKFWEPQLQPRSTVACRNGPRTVKNCSLFTAVKTLPARHIEPSRRGHRYRPAPSTALPEACSPFTAQGCRPLVGGYRTEFTVARRAPHEGAVRVRGAAPDAATEAVHPIEAACGGRPDQPMDIFREEAAARQSTHAEDESILSSMTTARETTLERTSGR